MKVLNNQKLRSKLEQIIQQNTGDQISIQITLIRELKKEFTHSIELIEEVNELSDIRMHDDNSHFSCFMWCFDLKYRDIKDENGGVLNRFPNEPFVSYLIENYLCEIDFTKAKDGDYVIYFQDEKPVHAGKLSQGKMISKWGQGHVWKHGIFEVPLKYGDVVKCFQKIPKNQRLMAFRQWVNETI